MMKKTKFLFFGILIIISFNSYSQKFKYGGIVGIDISNIYKTNMPDNVGIDYFPIISFNINGYIGYKNSKNWGISSEPGLIQKGERYYIDFYELNQTNRLYYFQLPILFDLYIKDKIYFSTGPELSYLIFAVIFEDDFEPYMNTYDFDKKFEVSAALGVNYKIIKNIDVGLKYSHGLSFIRKVTVQNEVKYFNRHLQLSLKYIK